MEENIQDEIKKNCEDEDLGNYITQVVTDIGGGVNCDTIKKICQVPLNTKFGLNNKEQRCKMASVAYPGGIPADEYSKFTIHVYQWLSYVKGLESPSFEELEAEGKVVTMDRLKDQSKINTTNRRSYSQAFKLPN